MVCTWRKKEVLEEVKKEFETNKKPNMEFCLYNDDYIRIKTNVSFPDRYITIQLVWNPSGGKYSYSEKRRDIVPCEYDIIQKDIDKLMKIVEEYIDYSFECEEKFNKTFYGTWRR